MSPARPRSRRGEGERLHDEILEAAEHLLLETGSEDSVSIRAVADAVGVTAPSIYRHFPDKTTLLFDVCVRQFERLDAHLRAEMAAHGDDPFAALQACGRAYVRFGLEHPEHYRIMFMGRSDWTPVRYSDDVLVGGSGFMGLVEVVAACIEAVDPDSPGADLEPFATAALLWTAVHGITSLLISKPNFPWPGSDALVDTCCTTMVRGLFGR